MTHTTNHPDPARHSTTEPSDPSSANPATPTIPPRRPSPGDAPPVPMSDNAARSVLELLQLCDLFLRTATPAVRAELSDFLAHQPTPLDANLLIDMLGFNALYLESLILLTGTHHAGTHHADTGSVSRGPA